MNQAGKQLDGWKEIAQHLNRSVRCVQRWERHESLPVLRHGHTRGASVYAFRDELNAWWQGELRGSSESPVEESSNGAKSKKATKGVAIRGGQNEFGLTVREASAVLFLLRQLKKGVQSREAGGDEPTHYPRHWEGN